MSDQVTTNHIAIRSDQELLPRYAIKNDTSWEWAWALESKLYFSFGSVTWTSWFPQSSDALSFGCERSESCSTKPGAVAACSTEHKAKENLACFSQDLVSLLLY